MELYFLTAIFVSSIYAAFLQEAADRLNVPQLSVLSEKMTAVGDRWRRFALLGSRNCKGRAGKDESYGAMPDILRDCAVRESDIYQELLRVQIPIVEGYVESETAVERNGVDGASVGGVHCR